MLNMLPRIEILTVWNILIFLASRTVSGTVMELIPNPFILGQNGTLAMNCFLDNTEKGTSIKALSKVSILRNSTREKGQEEEVVIAQTLYGSDPNTGLPIILTELGQVSDVRTRNPTVTGDMRKLSTENIAEVRLTWDARGIVCEDMGSYHCQVHYTDINDRDAVWTTTSVLRPLSYPANLVMTVQGKNNIPGFPPQNTDEGQMENTALEFKEGDAVDMQCAGIIGNDRNTKIKWFRTRDFSEDPNDIQRFNGPDDILDEGTVPEEMENCRYSRTSTVKYIVTEMDAARTRPFMFLCRIEYTMNGVSMTLSSDRKVFIHASSTSVSGTVMELIPNPVILGQNDTLAMNCFLDNTAKGTSIKALSKVRILRNGTREKGQEYTVVIAQTQYGSDPTTGLPIVASELGTVSDVRTRNPTVTGDMRKLATENIAEVRLTWDAREIVCEDMGSYHCQVQYTDINDGDAVWTTTSVLRPLSYPVNLVMTVQGKNNIPGFPTQNTDEGQMESTALEFKEGDAVDMQCTGVIGNDRNTKIKWYRTRDFSEDPDDLQRFNGPTLDEGTVPEEMENCRYSRTSTVKYNVTEMDAARTRPFMFLCRIEYTMNGVAMHIDGNRKVFIHADSRSGTSLQAISPSPTVSMENTSTASWDRFHIGFIVGGLVGGAAVAILVVIMIFWRRQRRKDPEASSAKASNNGQHVNNATGSGNVQPRQPSFETSHVNGSDGNGSTSISTNASNNDAHVYTAIDSSNIQPSIYTGLEIEYEEPDSTTRREQKYENVL